MNMFSYLFLLLLSYLPAESFSQTNLAGNWTGTITQNEGGYRSEYSIQLQLQQKGNQIIGRSFVKVDNIHAEMELEGTFTDEKIFSFQELKIVSSKNGEGMEWCLKKGDLKLKNEDGNIILEGVWQGDTSFSHCIPGKIVLKKMVVRA